MVTLKLFDPDNKSSTGGLSQNSTLTDLFERAFVPVICNGRLLSAKTVCLYREAISWWREITGDPPLCQITDEVASQFVHKLRDQPGRRGERLAIATIRKHAKAIDTLLRFSGRRERTRTGYHNQELLEWPPRILIPSADIQPVCAVFTEAEIAALLKACPQMRSPNIGAVSPELWWESLILVAVYTGLRISQLMGLRFADLRPAGTGQGWILVPAGVSKGRRGKLQFLIAPALTAIERIRSKRELIFEHPSWPRNPRYLQAQLKRLAKAAGLPVDRRFGFHAFRRAHASLLALSCGQDRGWEVAQASLGHADVSTTRDYYVAQTAKEALVAASLSRLPSFVTSATPVASPPDVDRGMLSTT